MAEGDYATLVEVPGSALDGYEPIDMAKYPYKENDKLANGIVITRIQRGDKEDSFGGFLCRPKIPTIGMQWQYGPTVLVATMEDTMKHMPGPGEGYVLEHIGHVGNPYAQMIWFLLPGEKNVRNARPDKFLEIAKMVNPKGENEDTSSAVVDAPSPAEITFPEVKTKSKKS
jgi:hypothetical protein